MKILWISHGSTLEGAERCLVEAVKSLSSKGEEVHIIVPSQGKIVSLLEKMTTSIHIINLPRWVILPLPQWIKKFRYSHNIVERLYKYWRSIFGIAKLYKYWRSIFGIARLLSCIQPDIVITNTITIPCGAVAAKLLGIPHIWYIHEFLEEDHGWSFEFGRELSLLFIDKFSQIIIVNSQAVYNKFSQKIYPKKMHVIYQAANIEFESNLKSDLKKDNTCFYLVLVGRKTFGKGQEDAIKALSILVNKKLDVYLWLVGSDFLGYTNYLRKLANNLAVSHKVEFISFVNNPLAYMDAADVVLMCSRCEAFGRVTVEAMKLGKAVIGSDSGATPELIKDGWNGLTYEVNNAESLAEKIELLYNDRCLKQQIEINAYNWANINFNLEKYSSELLDVFSNVLVKPSRSEI